MQRVPSQWTVWPTMALEVIFERFLGKTAKVKLSDNMCVVEFKGVRPY